MTEDDLRDLSERTQQIQQLTETIGWELYFDRAKHEIEQHQNRILGGRLDESDYHREAGFVQGALAMLGLPQQAVKEYQAARTRFEQEKAFQEAERVEVA